MRCPPFSCIRRPIAADADEGGSTPFKLLLNLVSRIFGMILIAIAVQFMIGGLLEVFPGWGRRWATDGGTGIRGSGDSRSVGLARLPA
jgi:hypothetical protein